MTVRYQDDLFFKFYFTVYIHNVDRSTMYIGNNTMSTYTIYST